MECYNGLVLSTLLDFPFLFLRSHEHRVELGRNDLVENLLLQLVVAFPNGAGLLRLDDLGLAFLRTQYARGDVLTVLPEDVTAEDALQDEDRLEAETRADLHQRELVGLLVRTVVDLVVTHPNSAVEIAEREHVVDERLALRVALRDGEDLTEQLARERQVRLLAEAVVEREDRTRALQTVAEKPHFVHRADVLDEEFDRRADVCLRRPKVQIGVLSRFEIEAMCAVADVAHLQKGFKNSVIHIQNVRATICSHNANNFIKKIIIKRQPDYQKKHLIPKIQYHIFYFQRNKETDIKNYHLYQ